MANYQSNDKIIAWIFKETRGWDNPPTLEKIKQDIERGNYLHYMYPSVIRVFDLKKAD